MGPEPSNRLIERPIETRELRALVAISDLGSFRAAATQLGYTQSAISHQIAELERLLGALLFTRPGGRGRVSLTRAGEAAYVYARRAISELHALEASVRAARSERTVVRVGVFQTGAAELLPAALRLLRGEWPGVEFVLTDTSEDPRLVDWLAGGRLDLALTINQVPDDRIEVIRLLDDPWVILTRRDSKLAAADSISFELLDGDDVVAWTARSSMQIELEAAWRRRGISPHVIYRTDDNLSLQRLVAAGLGHACIGRLAARSAIDPMLVEVAPRDYLSPRTIAICHPRQRNLAEAAQALSSALRAQFSE